MAASPRDTNNFDLLRIIAAFMVVFSHYLRIFAIGGDPLKALTGISAVSTVGIIIFFVISGYLVTRSAFYAQSRREYLRNRVLRIVPGYYMCLILTVFVIGAVSTTWPLADYFSSHKTWLYFLNGYFYTLQYQLPGVFEENPRQYAVNGSIWTLCVEITAYLLLVFAIGGDEKNKRKKLLWVVSAVLLFHLIYHDTPWLIAHQVNDPLGNYFLWYFNVRTGSQLIAYFMLGGLLSLLPKEWFTRTPLAALLLGLWVASWGTPAYYWVEFIALPYFVLYVAFHPRLFSLTRMLRKTGDNSYGIYLYHAPIGQACWALMHNGSSTPVMVAVALLVTYIAALASWWWLEKPLLGLKHYSSHREADGNSVKT